MLVIKGKGIAIYQAMTIRKAIEFYLAHKKRLNSAYTPSNMLATAGRITGRDYGRWSANSATNAIRDLTAMIDEASVS